MAVHNEILRRRPDLAPVMAAPWYMDRKGEVPEGKQPYFQIPIFNYFKVSAAPLLKLERGFTSYAVPLYTFVSASLLVQPFLLKLCCACTPLSC